MLAPAPAPPAEAAAAVVERKAAGDEAYRSADHAAAARAYSEALELAEAAQDSSLLPQLYANR
jgi:hypothetical protein